MVSAAHRQCQRKDQAHRHSSLDAQADRGALALSYDRPCTRRCGVQAGERVTNVEGIRRRGTPAVSAGWMVTVAPLGQTKGRFVDGSHPRGFLAASMRNMGVGQAGPTGYEVMQ